MSKADKILKDLGFKQNEYLNFGLRHTEYKRKAKGKDYTIVIHNDFDDVDIQVGDEVFTLSADMIEAIYRKLEERHE